MLARPSDFDKFSGGRHDSAPLPTTHLPPRRRADSVWVAQSSSHSFFFPQPDPKDPQASDGLKRSHVIVNLVKCAIGAGSFSFPAAFIQTGIWFGAICLIAMAIVAAYTMTLLADAEKAALSLRHQPLMDEEVEKGNPPSAQLRMTYPEVMRTLFPEFCFCGRNVLGDLVNAFIILTSLLVSIVYILFIVNALHSKPFDIGVDYIMLFLLIPVGALAQLRSFKYLAFTSVLGDIAVTTGIVGTVIVGLTTDNRSISWPDTDVIKSINSDFGDVAQGVATISFLFLVHIMTLPMAQSLDRDLEDPKEFHAVAWTSYSFIGILNLIFTLVAVCIFWDDPAVGDGTPGIQSPVTNNLGGGAAPAVIKALLCVDLLFTIPMIMSVGREIVENAFLAPIAPGSTGDKQSELKRTLIRAVMTVVILGLSWGATKSSGVNQAFNDAIGLVGGLTNTTVGLIVPPFAFHRAVSSGEYGRQFWGGMLISVVGATLLVTSTYFTMKDIVKGK